MAWHLLEKVIEDSATHSSLLGKWWIAIMFVFRIIVVASIGDTVYSDEQDEFICNTRQPGCKQICYNKFAPISHIRFWAFQILATGTPSVIFIIFAMHKQVMVPSKPEGSNAQREISTQTSRRFASSQTKKRNYRSEHDDKKSESKYSNSSNNTKYSRSSSRDIEVFQEFASDTEATGAPPQYEKVCRERKVKRAKATILRAYVIQVFFRTGFEAVFLYLQFSLYSLSVPEFYECIRYPCPKIVECYVSRPQEKTIFLYFMFVVGCVCLFINVLELKYLGWRRLKRVFSKPKSQNSVPTSTVLGSTKGPNHRNDQRSIHRHPLGRIIHREAATAPPGYYIPDVDPPSEKYRSPANGFPHIRLRAASFTTSESDVTTDDDQDSMDSGMHVLQENTRVYL